MSPRSHEVTNETLERPWIRSQRIVAVAFLVFLVLAIARCCTNLPWLDEGYLYDPVYTWLTKGHAGTTIVESKGFPYEGIERYFYWQPPLYPVISAAWLKVFGLSLIAFRSLSVVAGLCLLSCWAWLLRRLGAPRLVQLVALIVIATDYAVIRAASDGRADMLAAAFGLAGVTLYIKLRENNFAAAVLLSQALIVCGGLTHPMGGLLYLGMLVYFFMTGRDWRRLRWPHIAIAAIPYLIGAAGWGMYISHDPVLFRRLFFGASTAGRLNDFLHPFLALKNEILLRYLAPFGLRSPYLVARAKLVIPAVYLLAAAAVLFSPVRRQTFLRPFLAMWGVVFVGLLLLDKQVRGTYMVHILPLYAILLGAFTIWLWNRTPRLRIPVAALLAAFVVLQAGGTLYIVKLDPYHREYGPMIDFVRRNAQPGDRIVGPPEMGFGLGFDAVHDDRALGYFVNRQPDIIILDPEYREWYESLPKSNPAMGRFIADRFAAFRLAWRTTNFQVYLRRDRLGQS